MDQIYGLEESMQRNYYAEFPTLIMSIPDSSLIKSKVLNPKYNQETDALLTSCSDLYECVPAFKIVACFI